MLMRRATASVLFHAKVVLSIYSNFGKNSLLKCVSQPKIVTEFKGFHCSRSSMLVPQKAHQQCSKSAFISNRSHARRVNSGKRTVFMGYPYSMPSSKGIS